MQNLSGGTRFKCYPGPFSSVSYSKFGVDSILLGTLAYNVGPAKLLGSKTIPKSTLIKKLEAGDRNIYREYIAFCNYKGKRHAMLLKRRKAEFALLYIP